MLEVIQKLLIVQDRDRRIAQLQSELASIGPHRDALQAKTRNAQTALDASKHKLKQSESERKRLELEVDGKKQQIEKYSLQQFQTKKNEEYRALSNEIDNCRREIVKLEDQQLELMEQAERLQKLAQDAARLAAEAQALLDSQVQELDTREKNLSRQLTELEANRNDLTKGLDEPTLSRYQRLQKHRGHTIIVGVAHGVCGGCHMKLPMQILVSCRAEQEIVTCPNCARLLYYTRDMDMALAE